MRLMPSCYMLFVKIKDVTPRLLLVVCALVVLSVHFCAVAAERPSPNPVLSYAMKGIAKGNVAEVKENERGLEMPPEPITRKLIKRDPALAISVESVLRKLKNNREIVLIDVRSRGEFEKFRIPGSINISLFAIKTKAFVKSRPLVLINKGYHYGPLEKQCKRLRDSGFVSVRILNGGLNAWKQKGAPIVGNTFAQHGLNKIPPQIFFEEKNDEDWLVINVSKSKNPEALHLIPRAIAIGFADNSEQFLSGIKRAVARRKSNPLLSVLIFNESGEQYERIEKVIQASGIRNVFYLKGGLKGYKRFLQQQALMWQPKEHARKALKKCGGCP